jgi:alanine dehydrogenase
VTKVKEPTPSEIAAMRPGQALFDFLHLAPEPELTRRILDRGIVAIGFETVQLDDGSLPLLVPMSEVAGRLAVQIGAHYLQADQGGRGVLLGGVPGVPRGRVTVIGAGIVGTAAVRMAAGLGAEVSVLDIDQRRLSHLYDIYLGGISTLYSNVVNLEQAVLEADLVIGAVLVPGARAPRLVGRELVAGMRPGSVIVDVAVDQGGCVETIRPTSHSNPTYSVDGVIHYGVPNMPGAVPRTSTLALTNATFPYLMELCRRGIDGALRAHPPLARGVNCYRGHVTQKGVAEALGLPLALAPWAAAS